MKCKVGFQFCKFEKAYIGSHYIFQRLWIFTACYKVALNGFDTKNYITFIKIILYYQTQCSVSVLHI